jgi:hypothetical protein
VAQPAVTHAAQLSQVPSVQHICWHAADDVPPRVQFWKHAKLSEHCGSSRQVWVRLQQASTMH